MRRVLLDTNIYGKIIEQNDLDFVLENIAKSGIIVYGCDVITKELGGTTSKEKLLTDFVIVALASKNNLDIVYSSDTETMLSYLSMKAYDIVNTIRKIRTPNFKNYGDFKNEIKM